MLTRLVKLLIKVYIQMQIYVLSNVTVTDC